MLVDGGTLCSYWKQSKQPKNTTNIHARGTIFISSSSISSHSRNFITSFVHQFNTSDYFGFSMNIGCSFIFIFATENDSANSQYLLRHLWNETALLLVTVPASYISMVFDYSSDDCTDNPELMQSAICFHMRQIHRLSADCSSVFLSVFLE